MPWRTHYDRLHLHTTKRLSQLPYKKFQPHIPKYPGRLQVLEYLESYQRDFNIQPVFDTQVRSIQKEDNEWITISSNGIFRSKHLIMATGAYGRPRPVDFKGIDSFTGSVLHSSQYKTGKQFHGQKILVVGFGNSACEIALDLYEEGAFPSMSVRSPVNVLPRDIFGIPVLKLGLLMSVFPPRLADKLTAPLIRLLTGDITEMGLRKLTYGPLEQIQKDQTVPLLDIGTVKLIREKHCVVYDDIDHIENKTVFFQNGKRDDFEGIVAAIGYDKAYEQALLEIDKTRFDDLNVAADRQKYFGKDGLYFCGFYVSPTGQIREIGLDAQRIARSILRNNSEPNKKL